VNMSVNVVNSDLSTGPYQSKPTIGVYNEDGVLTNTLDVGPDETRRTICADGSDCGSDQEMISSIMKRVNLVLMD